MQQQNSAKCNLNAIHLEMTKTQTRVQGTTCKEQIPLPNIHLNKGKYPQSSRET